MSIQNAASSGPNWDLPVVFFAVDLVSFFFCFETFCPVEQSSFPVVETFSTPVLSLYPAPQRHYLAWMTLSLSLGLDRAQFLEMTFLVGQLSGCRLKCFEGSNMNKFTLIFVKTAHWHKGLLSSCTFQLETIFKQKLFFFFPTVT